MPGRLWRQRVHGEVTNGTRRVGTQASFTARRGHLGEDSPPGPSGEKSSWDAQEHVLELLPSTHVSEGESPDR